MKRKYVVRLSEQEREMLTRLLGAGTSPARTLTRARVLLKSDEGREGGACSYAAIEEALEVSDPTVWRIRRRYVEQGLEAALYPRPSGRDYSRKLEGEQEAHLVALVCGGAPEGRKRWTLRLLADKLVELGHVEAISHETVRYTLKKTNLSLG